AGTAAASAPAAGPASASTPPTAAAVAAVLTRDLRESSDSQPARGSFIVARFLLAATLAPVGTEREDLRRPYGVLRGPMLILSARSAPMTTRISLGPEFPSSGLFGG